MPRRPTPPYSALAVLALLLAVGPATAQPGDAAERRAYVEGRFVRALTFHAVGDDGAAAAALDELLELRPDDAAVYDARAEVALTRGEPTDALFYAERAVALAPDSAPFRRRLAAAHAGAGRLRDAVEAAEAARDLAPTDPASWQALAGLYRRADRADAEREALAAWVRLSDTAPARLRLSTLYEADGDESAALDQARAARRLAPGDPDVLRRLAALDRPAPDVAPPQPVAASGNAQPDDAGWW